MDRTYSLKFKFKGAQEYLYGEFALAALARQHDMCRLLIHALFPITCLPAQR